MAQRTLHAGSECPGDSEGPGRGSECPAASPDAYLGRGFLSTPLCIHGTYFWICLCSKTPVPSKSGPKAWVYILLHIQVFADQYLPGERAKTRFTTWYHVISAGIKDR